MAPPSDVYAVGAMLYTLLTDQLGELSNDRRLVGSDVLRFVRIVGDVVEGVVKLAETFLHRRALANSEKSGSTCCGSASRPVSSEKASD